MRVNVDVTLPCTPARAFAELDDLQRYPHWMGLVHAATPEPGGDAWAVELRGKVGPFTRSKKLRMVRTAVDAAGTSCSVRFERRDIDGREHGTWVLDASVIQRDDVDSGAACDVRVSLEYGGRLWSGVVDAVLRDEIERSKQRLREIVTR